MKNGCIFACMMVIAASSMLVVCPGAAAADEQIIFSSNRGGAWSIWTVKPDGSQLTQLSQPAAGEQDVDPAFSPDGSKILFTSTRGGSPGLWQMTRDGKDAKRICDGDQGGWSPDGEKIVLRRGGKLVRRDLGSGKEQVISPP